MPRALKKPKPSPAAKRSAAKRPGRDASSRSVSSLPTKKADQLSANRSFVLYGQSGTGKTTLAGTFPGPVLLCDCRDRGTDSVVGIDNLDVMEIEEWDDAEQVFWFLKKNPKKYKTVIWDTMSQLQGIAIEKTMQDKGKDPSRAGDWGAMTQRDWGDVAALMKPFITNFRDLPMDVVFIAQHRVFNVATEDEEDPSSMILAPEVGPQLMPSVAKHMNASVSVIGNTFIRSRIEEKVKKIPARRGRKAKEEVEEVEHIEYCLRIGPNSVYTTKVRKSRSIKLPDVIVDPTYTKILNVLKGAK